MSITTTQIKAIFLNRPSISTPRISSTAHIITATDMAYGWKTSIPASARKSRVKAANAGTFTAFDNAEIMKMNPNIEKPMCR